MIVNVQYGCGLSAPEGWINFDASPTLRLQKLPLLGKLVKKVDFPANVLYGDIVKGLPGIKESSCDTVYCSHVLEHLSYEDCKLALKNTYAILKPGGRFRCVLPDLGFAIEQYLKDKKEQPELASIHFMQTTLLGYAQRPKGIKEKIMAALGNSHHLWMWDRDSLTQALKDAGFNKVSVADFNDSEEKSFMAVEDSSRFWGAVALEAIK
jgi:ubiquinone/menaquinone biosynthesis C-methylase UbiE